MKLLTLIGFVLLANACGSPLAGIVTSDERRVWVTKDGKLFRCADASLADEPPRPVCVRTVFAKKDD